MKAIITTSKDLSAEYFGKHNWDILNYNSIDTTKNYDLIYFRDPFNDDDISNIQITRAISYIQSSQSIDHIKTLEDMMTIEDKYHQYEIYRNLMPPTFLPSEISFVEGKYVAKKRISQRAKDILFSIQKPLNNDWIIQEIIHIKEELRAYAIFGKVIPMATIKSSKANGKVKVIGGRKLSNNEIAICEEISAKSKLDFIGIDLAILADGSTKLIEVNRSPQFKRFAELYGEKMLSGILNA